MNIERLYPSFSIAVVGQNISARESVVATLKEVGFRPQSVNSLNELLQDIQKQPPHMLFLHVEKLDDELKSHLVSLKSFVPESHVFLLCSPNQCGEALESLFDLVSDCLAFPLSSKVQILKAAGRAAERDYYMYKKEQQVTDNEEFPSLDQLDRLETWMNQALNCQDFENVVSLLLADLHKWLGSVPLMYFHYISSQHSLMAQQSWGLDGPNVRGLGVHLKKESSTYDLSLLKHPLQLVGLRQLIGSAFSTEEYEAIPLILAGEVKGIVVVIGCLEPTQKAWLRLCALVLRLAGEKLLFQSKLHKSIVNDEKTHVLNRQSFSTQLSEEISRARRTRMPVCLLLMSIDDMPDLRKRLGESGTDLILKTVASIVKKNSRINDITGRISSEEFGVLLPHTSWKGAAVKAERLRRIIESADFSRFWQDAPKISVSQGISEYPSHCHDADELLELADEALFEVKKSSRNKVCMAGAPKGFVPEFDVQGPPEKNRG